MPISDLSARQTIVCHPTDTEPVMDEARVDDGLERAFPDVAGCSPSIGIAILAKAPIPGLSKTRLIPRLGAEGAAVLQRWLLSRSVSTAVAAATGPVTVWCTPTVAQADFHRCAEQHGVTLREQPAGDLGARMFAALQASPTPVGTLLVGTDCPCLTPALLRTAAAALNDSDAVLIPAEDGGYVLLGLRYPDSALFASVEWGSDRVLTQTRQRLGDLHWQWCELATLWDVDRPGDYQRLLEEFPELATMIARWAPPELIP